MVTENIPFKEKITERLLYIIIGWACFCVGMTAWSVICKESAVIITGAGADTLLGALLMKFSDAWQYWFRKKPSEVTKCHDISRGISS